MSTRIKGLLPRVALRIKDSATGSYPSNVRTGDDSRTGEYNVFYNDVNTINFSSRDNVITRRWLFPLTSDVILPNDANTRHSKIFMTKRDSHFGYRYDRGNYDSSSDLVAHFGFGADRIHSTVGDDIYFTTLPGGSGPFVLTGTFGLSANLDTSDKPRIGSDGSLLGFQPLRPHFKVGNIDVERFSFGDGATDAAFSVSTWIQLSSFTSENSFGHWFVSKQESSSNFEWAFGMRGDSDVSDVTKAGQANASGSLFLRLYDNSLGVTSSYEARTDMTIESSQPAVAGNIADHYEHPRANEWIHFVATYDGTGDDPETDVVFYINGIRVQPEDGAIVGGYVAMENTGAPLYFGTRTESGAGNASSPLIGGKISDTAIWNGVLRDEEVKEIYGFRRGINMPTGLDANSPFLTEDLRTDIFVPQAVTKGVIDNFISFTPGESITPFNESFRPEQSQTSSFYLTGTRPSDSSLGFSGKVASKTQIKFEFTVDSLEIMNSSSASIVYYNKDSNTFDLAGGSSALTNPARSEERAMMGRDCRLFGPFGLPLMSGNINPLSSTPLPSPFHSVFISGALDRAMAYVSSENCTLNSNFEAVPGQLIPLSGVLNSPFLLEKAVIQMPISSSDGWFNDQTRVIKDGAFHHSDAGGPCVTVSLLNQVAGNRRDLILSATIIPEGDATSFRVTSPDTSTTVPMPGGFLSFSTPNAIVRESGVQEVFLASEASVVNAVIGMGPSAAAAFEDSYLGEVSPFGRSMNSNEPSARSFFGKEFTVSSLKEEIVPKYTLDNLSGNVYMYESHKPSPYLLFPTDNLILAVSKHRPVMSGANFLRNILTGSHEFGLPAGTIKIKLYGSLVRESEEFHDTLNQNLMSDSIHEQIFGGPVLDQFDIEPRSSFSGSYIAEFFTGSMLISGAYDTASFFGNGYLDERRGVRSSIIGTPHTLIDELPVFFGSASFRIGKTGFNRATSHFSVNERYFDTLLPRPDQISNINGADILNDTSLNRNFFLLGRGSGYIDAGWIESWDMLYPFESKYSSVTRTTTPFRDILSTQDTSLNPSIVASSDSGIYRPESVNNTAGSINGIRIMHGALPSSSVLRYLPISNRILAKAMFTIGDGQFNEPIGISLNAGGSVAYDVLPRGFKYGLINSNSEKKKWKFRRDHYGQFRDMLEQAKDAKIYLEDKQSIVGSPVIVKFVNASGSAIDPENTFSSNMSTEATSSLPYFDDIGRNRGSLPVIN